MMTNERIQVEAENLTVPVSLGGGVKIATSSSAVAKRPRDASCLSVVSFNIPTAKFFITSYCGFKIY